VRVAELMTREDGTPISPVHAAIGALVLERCANLVRGETRPICFTDADVAAFAKSWDVKTRAKFNPPTT
jgi:hypothetical protein